jgi:competence protein ComFC
MKEGLSGVLAAAAKQARSVLVDLQQLLWPLRCEVCRVPLGYEEKPLCRECWNELSLAVSRHYCRRCGRSVSPYGIMPGGCGHCQEESFKFDAIARAGMYTTVLRQLILNLKFKDATELTGLLGGMIRDAFRASGLGEQTDLIVPVPLHWRRRLERGFNQSDLLAGSLRDFAIPVSRDLVRVRYTSRQWNLTSPERRRNVKNAFRVRQGHPFEGKRTCLVDDITTSGATLNECAATLKAAGAAGVTALVLAVAENVD